MTAFLNQVPCLPSNAPFSLEQRAWINGFLAGIFSHAPTDSPRAVAPANQPNGGPLLILWGSQTGSAEGLAKRVAKEAAAKGFAVTLLDAAKHGEIDWHKQKRLLLVTSTWGDGEPPDNALGFWTALNSPEAPSLAGVEFAVLALGDRNYSSFCGAGKKFDERCEQLGGKRLLACAECDVDYEGAAKAWLDQFWAPESNGGAIAARATSVVVATTESKYSRTNPFPAVLISKRLLNAPISAKETRHFEFNLEGSDLDYEAGDALGICPSNDPALVENLLATLGYTGEESVAIGEAAAPVREALLHKLEITRVPRELVSEAGLAEGERLLDLLDVLGLAPKFRPPAQELAAKLKKLQPRLYSISSSPKAHAGQVHLTVSIVRYEAHGRWRGGVCSTYLADRLPADSPAPIFVHKSPHFRLPADAARPVIMVGPGTGIAPFRAFLNERQAVGAPGKNWLFFGDQRRATDFLYQEEIEQFLRNGALNHLDLAFSRDQEAKVYVQDRMRERADEIWKWLDEGAHFYVCGDAKRMAKDVDEALHEIIEKTGGLSRDAAAEFVLKLKSEKRYQRDVY